MEIQRCPECGGRLKTNYCDVCLRKVPFKGTPSRKHVDGSSAHRDEGHTCIDFGDTGKKIKFAGKKASADLAKKKGTVIGIFVAIMSVLAPLFGLLDEAAVSVSPEPEINVSDGFVEAGQLGAENVPNVIAGELYNANGIRITADTAGLSYGDYTVFLTLENATEQKLSVSLTMASVNDYMVPFGLFHDLKPGQTDQTFLRFYSHELEKAGISQVADVTLVMDVYETDTYEEIITGELLTIKTEYDGSAEPAVDISGLELYNDGSVRMILRDATLPGFGDCELELYAENMSERTVSVYTGSIFVNGESVQGYYSRELRPNTRAVDNTYIYELEDLELEELAQIEEITLELYVDYMDGWDIVESASEAVTFNPNEIR